jgi:hypothetical protein
MQALLCSRRIPGPTSFWEVVVIPPERHFFRKVFSLSNGLSLQGDNKTVRLSGAYATCLVQLLQRSMNSFDVQN